MGKLTICEHPLLQDKLALLRDKNTPPALFRELMEGAGTILAMEALSNARLRAAVAHTPLKPAQVRRLSERIVVAAVLRAGLGMMEGVLRIAPEARIGHIGVYRNEETLNPVRYYVRLPKDLASSFVLALDPMLATGGSASEALRILKTDGAKNIRLVSLLATRQGIRRVHRDHPDTHIFTAAVDPVLNESGYILPGLGDAGDRLFGTF